jgi:hypothetical protein
MNKLRQLYEVLQSAQIDYRHEPAAATGGQPIRSADEVLHMPRQGTCLEVCLLYAGAVLDAGLHPAVVVLDREAESHAVVVVWLEGSWPRPSITYPFADVLWRTAPQDAEGTGLLEHVRTESDSPGSFVAIDVACATRRAGDDLVDFDLAVIGAATQLHEWAWSLGVDVGLAHLRAGDELAQELFQAPAGPTSEPVLVPAYMDDNSGSPLAQIAARKGVVGFYPTTELEWFKEWAEDPSLSQRGREGLRIAMVTGVGGAGKTRLAAQLCRDLGALGWYTGFLTPNRAADDAGWLARLPSKQVIVIDYAEEWETERLSETLQRLQSTSSDIVLVLTARQGGQWWKDARDKAVRAGANLADPYCINLHPSIRNQRRLFEFAVRDIQRANDSNYVVPDFREDEKWTTLDVVTQAWLAASGADGLAPNRSKLYAEILDREFGYWAHTLQARGFPDGTPDELAEFGAAVTLLGPRTEEHVAMVSRAVEKKKKPFSGKRPGPEKRKRGKVLADLLGGHESGSLAVRPDPIGEYLITEYPLRDGLRLPEDQEQWETYLSFKGLTDKTDLTDWREVGRVQHAFATITRAGERGGPDVQRWAQQILQAVPETWPIALATANGSGGPFVSALEKLAATDETPMPLAVLSSHVGGAWAAADWWASS